MCSRLPNDMDRSVKKRLRQVASITLMVVFLLTGFFLLKSNWSEIQFTSWKLLPYLLVALLIGWIRLGLRSWLQWRILVNQGVQATRTEILGLAFATRMMNGVLPLKLGSGYAGAYLKKRHAFPYRTFVSMLLGVNLLLIVFALSAGTLAAFALRLRGDFTGGIAQSIIVIFLLFLLGGFIFNFAKTSLATRSPLVSKITQAWSDLWGQRELWAPVIWVSLLTTVSNIVGLILAFAAFDTQLNISGATLLMASQTMGNLATITPGGFGFKELAGAYFASALGITVAQTILVLATYRVCSLISYLIPGVPSFFWLSARLRSSDKR